MENLKQWCGSTSKKPMCTIRETAQFIQIARYMRFYDCKDNERLLSHILFLSHDWIQYLPMWRYVVIHPQASLYIERIIAVFVRLSDWCFLYSILCQMNQSYSEFRILFSSSSSVIAYAHPLLACYLCLNP